MSVLIQTEKVIIVNAGHHNQDSGAVVGSVKEVEEAMKVRDQLYPILKERGYTIHNVPDNLNLTESIAWANKKAPNLHDALAIDIHFNAMNSLSARGTEAFYGSSETSRLIAKALSFKTSESLGIPNRGARPDTSTYVGSLGWIRKTTMWASLIEVCFLTNKEDMAVITGQNGYKKAALGIANGVDDIFGIPRLPEIEDPLEAFTTMQLIVELTKRLKELETK